MSYARERFRPQLMAANASVTIGGNQIGGFLAKTAGTISVVDSAGNTIVDAVPLSAGIYLPMPFVVENAGLTVTLAGGASGTLAV